MTVESELGICTPRRAMRYYKWLHPLFTHLGLYEVIAIVEASCYPRTKDNLLLSRVNELFFLLPFFGRAGTPRVGSAELHRLYCFPIVAVCRYRHCIIKPDLVRIVKRRVGEGVQGLSPCEHLGTLIRFHFSEGKRCLFLVILEGKSLTFFNKGFKTRSNFL